MERQRRDAFCVAAGLCIGVAAGLCIGVLPTTKYGQGIWVPPAAPAGTGGWKTLSVFISDSKYGRQVKWHSQDGQDKLVADIFDQLQGGYFVDLAANDADRLSNTLSLEQLYGWTGVCIEANIEYMWGLVHRKCHVAWAVVWNETGTVVKFAGHPGGANGYKGGVISNATDVKLGQNVSFAGRVVASDGEALPAVALADVLAHAGAPRVIHYLSLDVEGAEWVVMQNFPLEKYTFLALTIERPKPPLVERLLANGYVQLKKLRIDTVFVHRSIPGFAALLSNHSAPVLSNRSTPAAPRSP